MQKLTIFLLDIVLSDLNIQYAITFFPKYPASRSIPCPENPKQDLEAGLTYKTSSLEWRLAGLQTIYHLLMKCLMTCLSTANITSTTQKLNDSLLILNQTPYLLITILITFVIDRWFLLRFIITLTDMFFCLRNRKIILLIDNE